MSKPKALRIWNGRLYEHGFSHGYVCAYSKADAVRLINELGFFYVNAKELTEYWAECWGTSMEGVTPERGLWADKAGAKVKDKPVRILVKQGGES